MIQATHGLPKFIGKKLHHIGLVVKELDASALSFWSGEATVPFHDAIQKVCVQFVRVADGTFIEMIQALPGSPVGAFLGLHHLAYEVPDVAAELALSREWGIPVGKPFVGFEGRELAFIMVKTGARLLVELVGPVNR